jgi:membrane protein DedA with SNARE-associated domain
VDIALVSLGTKNMDTVLAMIMFACVALAAAAVLFLLGRHHHRKRKARKHAKNDAKHS